jgi:hypothetical protein
VEGERKFRARRAAIAAREGAAGGRLRTKTRETGNRGNLPVVIVGSSR